MSLLKILKLAREIEASWGANAERDLTGHAGYRDLKDLIATHPDERLRKSAAHLHDRVTLAHFYSVLVPFERLANKSPRDDEFLVTESDRTGAVQRLPLKLVVENLRSAFNVGAVFRTAECLGVSEILLCGYTPEPSRTAMGTAEMIPWRQVRRAPEALAQLRTEGYTIVALETTERAVSLHDFKFSSKTAFVIGNERFGLDQETLRLADAICQIPVRGLKNSLNVGVAFGIAAFEWLRQHEN